jgi:hypothetical protein
MTPRTPYPDLMPLGEALWHLVVLLLAAWVLRRLRVNRALRITGDRLPTTMARGLDRVAARAAGGICREAGRLGLETAPFEEIRP